MSSFTVLFGVGGAGKTSWINAQLYRTVENEGPLRLKLSKAQIDYINLSRQNPLTPPDKIPMFTNFDAKYHIGYKKWYKPYYLDEAFFGLPNLDKVVAAVPPWSVVAFQELDDEYDSRTRKQMLKSVKGIYNERRHWNLDIFADLHRFTILDSILRDVADRIIEMRHCVNEKGFAGDILSTTWYYREFYDIKQAQRYISTNGAEGKYEEKEETFIGNIFECYDTHSCAQNFIPKEGDDFVYLKQRSEVDITKLSPDIAKFYMKGAQVNNG